MGEPAHSAEMLASMTTDDIAAIVVSHESAETIQDCLQRLRHAVGVTQVRVIDNDSRDGTLAIVQRHAAADAHVRFIGNPDNPGFAVACQQGVDDCDAPWLAFVNPDCLLEPDALARLLAHARALGGDVLLGADLVDESGVRDAAARRRDPDFGSMLRIAFGGGTGRAGDGRGAREFDIPPDAHAVQRVDAVSGALMLMPRTLYRRIGGFDTGYRLHAEDLDLCRRARDAGAIIAVANDVQVVHIRGVSSRARPVFVEWHKHRGLARYFRKFEAPRRNMLVRGLVYLAIWARFPLAALRARNRALAS